MDTLVDKLQSGETMESLSEGMQYYAYYSKAYTAVLGGMVGDYQIETTSENGETVWQDKYGLLIHPLLKIIPLSIMMILVLNVLTATKGSIWGMI